MKEKKKGYVSMKKIIPEQIFLLNVDQNKLFG